jgi:hypothetical protein
MLFLAGWFLFIQKDPNGFSKKIDPKDFRMETYKTIKASLMV